MSEITAKTPATAIIPATGMTVDWSRWMSLSQEGQDALWARYRQIVKAESNAALGSNYAAMNAAIRGMSSR